MDWRFMWPEGVRTSPRWAAVKPTSGVMAGKKLHPDVFLNCVALAGNSSLGTCATWELVSFMDLPTVPRSTRTPDQLQTASDFFFSCFQ